MSEDRPFTFSYLSLIYYILEYVIHRFFRLLFGVKPYDEMSMEGKTVLITGANSGLGKETAKAFAGRGARVIMACRNMRQGEIAVNDIKGQNPGANLVLKHLDLSCLESIRSFAKEVKKEFSVIHLLVNNAGIYQHTLTQTNDGFEAHFGVNHLGHFLLTNLILDNVKAAAPSRIVTVSSTNCLISELDLSDVNMTRVTSLGFQQSMPYNNSKMANALFAKELSRKCAGSGVTSHAICPGLVATDLFGNFPSFSKLYTKLNIALVGLSPEQGIETVLFCALSSQCAKETGFMYRFNRLFPSANSKIRHYNAAKLWSLSEQLVGLSKL